MLTLEAQGSFEMNANQTGLQRFEMVKRGTNVDGQPVYIFRRVYLGGPRDGQVFAYEVFIPKILKAGTVQKFPGGVEKLVEVDTEKYPNGAETDFGKRAWFITSLDRAESLFNELTKIKLEETHEETHEESEAETDSVQPVRGRPRNDRPLLTLPIVEFSVKELAEANKVDYPTAFVFLKEMEAAGKVRRTRAERRAARGKATQLFLVTTSN